MLFRDEESSKVATANTNIKKVNAALFVAKREPPASFTSSTPLKLKEHWNDHKYLLANEELPTRKANTIEWKKAPADSQAQMLAFYYHVRSSSVYGVYQDHCVCCRVSNCGWVLYMN